MISVIVPIYNVEKYLDKCIESVFAQTHKAFELILVDDGTRDACAEMSDEYLLRDARTITIHKPNGGLSSARNKGLDIAAGDYINFLDSDDYVLPPMLAEMEASAQAANADLCICGFNRVNEAGEITSVNAFDEPQKLSRTAALEYLVQGNVLFIIAWAKLYKRFIFSDLRFPDGKIHEDEYITHYVLGKCENIALVNEAFYMYLSRNDSIVGAKKDKRWLHWVEAYIDRIKYFHNEGFETFSGRVLAQTIPLLLTISKELANNDASANNEIKGLRKEILSAAKIVDLSKLPFTIKAGIRAYQIGDFAYFSWRWIYGTCRK